MWPSDHSPARMLCNIRQDLSKVGTTPPRVRERRLLYWDTDFLSVLLVIMKMIPNIIM